MDLSILLSTLGKSYKLYTKRLETINIHTVEDLLYYIPFRYEDYSLHATISSLQMGEKVTIRGTITSMQSNYTKRFSNIQKASLLDATGEIEIIWFNQQYLTKMIRKGDSISVSGIVEKNGRTLQLLSPEYELFYKDPNGFETPTIHTGRLVPVYHETKGVSSKWLRRQIFKTLKENKEKITDHLPCAIAQKYDLMSLPEALEQIHFPKSLDNANKARTRLAFDELFLSQLSAIHRRNIWKNNVKGQKLSIDMYREEIANFLSHLPFDLTNAQKNAVDEIFSDVGKDQPMNRLLEGDVGSGKTVVAAIAMYAFFLNNKQSVLMAPTEILAQQHFETISTILKPFKVTVHLVTGSRKTTKENLKNLEKNKIASFSADIMIGTHAVLSEKINFHDLGFVVIDEQQRFGVEQRSIIRNKGENPHFLTMTATPIPRTIALTMYGDLDLSFLDEMPRGRLKIKTWLVPPSKREKAYEWIRKEVQQTNSQAFIICPFIEESESMSTIKAATKEYAKLTKQVFPDLHLGLLHGKMKGKEKDEVLHNFKNKQYDILVATPVVEVGIDIPNATIILIEAAERFGLSQLHQLRGRVGRGNKQSYCLLFTDSKSNHTFERLKAMETMHVGSKLAEYDLQLRGPGEMYGTAQHGIHFFKIASFSDLGLLESAKCEAEHIYLELYKHPVLMKKIERKLNQKISPD